VLASRCIPLPVARDAPRLVRGDKRRIPHGSRGVLRGRGWAGGRAADDPQSCKNCAPGDAFCTFRRGAAEEGYEDPPIWAAGKLAFADSVGSPRALMLTSVERRPGGRSAAFDWARKGASPDAKARTA